MNTGRMYYFNTHTRSVTLCLMLTIVDTPQHSGKPYGNDHCPEKSRSYHFQVGRGAFHLQFSECTFISCITGEPSPPEMPDDSTESINEGLNHVDEPVKLCTVSG